MTMTIRYELEDGTIKLFKNVIEINNLGDKTKITEKCKTRDENGYLLDDLQFRTLLKDRIISVELEQEQ